MLILPLMIMVLFGSHYIEEGLRIKDKRMDQSMSQWSNGGCNRCVFKNIIGAKWTIWSYCPYCGRKLPKSDQKKDDKQGSNTNPSIKVQP